MRIIGNSLKYRVRKNNLAYYFFYVIGILGASLVLAIGIGLYFKSSPIIKSQGIFTPLISVDWFPLKGKFGILPFVISSYYISMLAIIITVPICLLTAIYLIEYAKKRILNFFYPIIDILAGLPSVILGVWGVIIVVPFIRDYLAPFFDAQSTGYSILAGAIVLSVMLVPNVILVFIEILRTIPTELREASLSLGATRWETIKFVVLRKSLPGIIAGLVLGMSRAFGETLAVLMVVGNVIHIPKSVFDPGYPLPALIANNYGEMLSIPLYDSALMYSALVLFVIVLFFNVLSKLFLNKLIKYMRY
jgi:phosphate transport system permease protein